MKKIIGLNVVRAMGMALATLTTAAMAYGPALPLTGWATQNGGTTGGANYGTVTVDNVSDLKSYAKAGNKTIYIKPGTYAGTIEVGSNVTLYGYPGVVITQPSKGSGVKLSGSKNVIIRNITVQGVGAVDEDDEDCLQINHESKNVWIDHVHVYDGHDGNMDIVNQSDYITVSWSKFTYTSKSTNHQFSNLFGNSDSKTADANALKITAHHNWWGDGVKERMPRVRFGQVHVVNNLFNSSSASYCVRAGMKANIRVENNVFIGVKNPLDYNNQSKEDAKVSMIGNYYEKTSGNTTGQGTAFTPSYNMGVTDVSTQAKAYALRDSIQSYAGPTLPAPGSSEVTPVSSASQTVVASSSSSAKSSSSVASSSSSAKSSASTATSSAASATSSAAASGSSTSGTVTSGAATLTKHGAGSSNQTVAAGSAIDELYFTITGATGATVTGLPAGVTGTLKGSDFYISGTVSATAEAKAYKWTVTTTGGSSAATKSGTFTVTSGNAPTAASSSASAASSNSAATVTPASSAAGSAETPGSAEVAVSSNSGTAVASSASETAVATSSAAASDANENSAVENNAGSAISANGESTMAITAAVKFQCNVSVAGRTLSIEGANGKAIAIFDMQGKMLAQGRINANQFHKDLPRPGTYLVRVGSMSKTISVR